MASRKDLIDVRTTAGTKKDMEAMAKQLASMVKSVNEIKKGFEGLTTLNIAAKTKGAFENQFGVGAYNRGQQFRERQRATEVARLGSATGQVVANQEALVKGLQKEMKTREGIQKVQAAQAMDTQAQIKNVAKLTQSGEILKAQELARLKNAEARMRLNDRIAQRDQKTALLRRKSVDDREGVKAARAADNAEIRTLRQTVRDAEKLEQLTIQRLETLKRETAEKAAQAKFDRESERIQSRSLASQNSLARDRERRRNAENLNLQKSLNSVRKINDLEALKTLKLRAQDRLRLEENKGNLEAVRQARVLNQLIERRVRLTQQAAAAAKEAAKPSKDELAAGAREMSMKRLFGDNGASLFAIQAGLVANYAAMNMLRTGLQRAVTFTVELDSAMRNLQAIVRITDTDMMALKESLIGISEETKFTAVEVANAAVTLGQAGFSTDEIKDSIRAVSLLATATGTDLSRAVDIATSTLGVFNMESSQMADVANILTEAVNTSKLNIEKLTLGLQYSGNIAAQSGVSFKELTSALGAMANAGIRSGSTLGTGMRQILIALQKPSKAFMETLARLGLTMEDVDLKSKGLYGALSNLKDAGFNSADAIKAFEVRAAAAYNALSGNLDQMLELQNAFQQTSASVQANETQMKSLANQGARLGSVLGSVAATGLDPLLKGLTWLTTRLGDALSWVRQFEGALQVLTTTLASLAVTGVVVYFGKMIGYLVKMIPAVKAVVVANLGAAASFKALSLAMLATPIGWLSLGLSTLAGAYYLLGGRARGAAGALEAAQTRFDRAAGAAEKSQKAITRVDGTLEDLQNRYDILKKKNSLLESVIQDVQKQFVDMGKDASNVGKDVDELISTMRNLRRELAEDYVLKVRASIQGIDNLITKTRNSLGESVKANIDETKKLDTQARYSRDYALASPNFDRLNQASAPLFSQNSSLNQVGTARVQMEKIQLELEKSLEEGTSVARGADEALVKYIKALLETSEDQYQHLQNLQNFIRQREAQVEEEKYAADSANPAVSTLLASSRELKADSGSDLMRGTAGMSARERFKVASRRAGELDKLIAADNVSLDTLMSSEVATSEKMAREIQQNLREASAHITATVQGLNAELQKVDEELNKINVSDQEQRLDKFKEIFNGAAGPAAIGEALADVMMQLEAVRKATIAEIKGQNLDPELEAARIDATNRDFDAQGDAFQQAGADRITEIADTTLEVNKRLSAQVGLQKLITKYGEDSRAVAQARLDIEKEKFRLDQLAKGIDPQEVEKQVDLLQQEADLVRLRKEQEIQKGALDENESMERELEIQRKILEYGANSAEVERARLEQRKALAAEAMREAKIEQTFITARLALMDQEFQLAKQIKQQTAEKDLERQIQQQVESNRIARAAKLLGEDHVVVVRMREKAEYNAMKRTLESSDASQELKDRLLAALRAGQALGRTDMSGGIRGAIKTANTLIGKLRTAAGVLATMGATAADRIAHAQIERETLGNPVEEARRKGAYDTTQTLQKAGLPKAAAHILGAFGGAIKAEAVKEEEKTQVARDAWEEANDPDSGGGGGSEGDTLMDKRQEAFDLLLARMKNTVDAGMISADNGGDGAAALTQIEAALARATVELEKRERLIGSIASKTKRTKAEEEMLTQLIKEHADLTSLVEDEEERILWLKEQQGAVQVNLNTVMREWGRETLSVTKTLEEGIKGVLGDLLNGFSTLFTDLVSGTKSAGAAFRGFAASVVQSLMQVIAKLMAIRLLKAVIGGLGPSSKVGNFLQEGLNMMTSKEGGRVQRKARGGAVEGNLARDSVPHLLMPGEYVLRTSAAKAIGYDTLDRLNAQGNVVRKAAGGLAGAATKASKGSGEGKPQNLWIVDERSRAPTPGPQDMVAVITDDIARNGPTGQLIRQISGGQR